MVADLLRSGVLERHVRRVRRVYAERLAALLAALEHYMPQGVKWTQPVGGHLVWVTLPPIVDPERLAAEALAEGVVYGRGSSFLFDAIGHSADLAGGFGAGGDRHLALSFINAAADVQAKGVAALASLVERQLPSLSRFSQRREL